MSFLRWDCITRLLTESAAKIMNSFSSVVRLALASVLCWLVCVPCVAKVLRPWTPVKAVGGAVSVWGRTYSFSSNALPVRIASQGVDLLAAPIRVVCADGKGAVHSWTKSGNFVYESDDESATVCGWMSVPDVFVNVTTRIEYDGMAKVSLSVTPGKSPAGLKNLSKVWLEIPLRKEVATLFNYSPCSWAKLVNVGGVKEQMSWPFRCSVWLGNEDVGLCWFCESDEKIMAADPARVVEVVPTEAETVLRIRLAEKTLSRPTTWVFGLEATPVKPIDNRLMAGRTVHAPPMGAGLSGTGVARPEVWWTNQRAFPNGNVRQVLEKAAKSGVRTVCFHEDWIPIQNNPSPRPDFKETVKICHSLGLKVLVYQGYELSPLDPLWGENHDAWLSKGNMTGSPISLWNREPSQRDYVVCYKSGFADAWLKRIQKAYDELGLDGVYLDGTIMPRMCANEAHGCGWRDASGKLHSTYPIFAVREMIRKLYEFVEARGGRLDAHQSGYVCPATLAFVHSYWDGEQLAVSNGDRNIRAELSLDAFRAEFMGRNHGIACELLAYEKKGWSPEDAMSVSLLHGVMVRPCGFASVTRFAPVWNAFDAFGVNGAEWKPYWKNAIPSGCESVKVTAWLKDKDALMVVSNISPADAATAHIPVPTWCRSARDSITGEPIPVSQGSIALTIEPFRYRLVRLSSCEPEAKGI